MSNFRHLTAVALSAALLASCAETTAPDPAAQTVIETLATKNANVVRLTVHAIPTGGTDYKAVASTLSSKLGKVSDPEDLRAIQSGEVVVLEEPGGVDVTVPIGKQNGKHTAAVGVTSGSALPSSMPRLIALCRGSAAS